MILHRTAGRSLAAFASLVVLVVALVAAVTSPSQAAIGLSPADRVALHAEIVHLLANEPELPLPVRQRAEALGAYYGDTTHPILWLGEPRAADLIAWLRNAAEDGLDPAAYPADQLEKLAAAVGETNSRGKAIVELHFSAAFLQFAADLQVGRFLPHKVDPDFFQEGRSIDQLGALTLVSVADSLDRFFIQWQPQAPEYSDLRAALADYRALAGAGGWPMVPLGDSLKPGMSDPSVPALRARLAVTDGANCAAPPGGELVYDDALVAVVKAFQARHGLDVDGVVGKGSVAALNVPVEHQVEDIVLSMERCALDAARPRPQPPHRQHRRLRPQARRHGRVDDRMKVVVGRPYNQTPVFSDHVRYLEFNPYWNVPTDIRHQGGAAQAQVEPGGAGRGRLRGGPRQHRLPADRDRLEQTVRAGQLPLPAPPAAGTEQCARPGQVPVPEPVRRLPARHARTAPIRQDQPAFAHGCVRLARPLDLATRCSR